MTLRNTLIAISLGVAGIGVGTSPAEQTPTTTLVSVGINGAQPNSNSRQAVISQDGSVVAFTSEASNLVASDTNSGTDVFVWDRASGTTQIVSLTSSGTQAAGAPIWGLDVSLDGRYIVFATWDALVPGDINSTTDVYLRDRTAGTTELVSIGTSGAPADGASWDPSISAGGHAVAFSSVARNLVAEQVNGYTAVFVRDRAKATTELVSRFSVAGVKGAQANHNSDDPSISGDGRYVAYTSLASNLFPFDDAGQTDVFVHDRTGLDGTELVSVSASGTFEGNRSSGSPSISYDGRFVAFASAANNLTIEGSNQRAHIYVRDRTLHKTQKVSIGSTAAEGNQHSVSPQITPDGRFVTFSSWASNIWLPDQNNAADIFIYDRDTLMLWRESVSSGGYESNADSRLPSISADGRFIVFESEAITLVPETQGVKDRVYIRDRATCDSGTSESGRVSSIVATISRPEVRELNCSIIVPAGL